MVQVIFYQLHPGKDIACQGLVGETASNVTEETYMRGIKTENAFNISQNRPATEPL